MESPPTATATPSPAPSPTDSDYRSRLLSYPLVGFTIAPQLHHWRTRVSQRIVELVSGARFPCHTPLPLQTRRPRTRLYRPEERAFYDFDIERRLRIGAIEEVPLAERTASALKLAWFSPEHLVPKKSDLPYRTVFNGHALSQYLETPPTRIKDLRWIFAHLPRGSWIYCYDLRDAFHSIVVHPDYRHLLVFVFGERLLRYRTLPQGASPSAPILCEVTTSLCDYWSAQTVADSSVNVSAYFDDLTGFALDQAVALQHSIFVGQEIDLLGLHWQRTKSRPQPAQIAKVLGYMVDSRTLTASLPEEKISKLMDHARRLAEKRQASAREALSMAGRLMDARHACSLFRACAYALYPHVSASESWDSVSPLSTEALARLQFFALNARTVNGRCFRYDPAVATVLATDARPTHWTATILSGAHAGLATSGVWPPAAPHLSQAAGPGHINYLELQALLVALDLFAPQLRGTTVWWWVDNQVAAAYVRKSGGPVDYMRSLTWCILERAQELQILLTPPRYIRSADNPADYGTRHRDLDSVRISGHTFDRLNAEWGPFAIDLFASSANALCSRFFTAWEDVGSAGVDALAQDWSHLRRAWIFPPSHLIHEVLLKVTLERPSGLLILPDLPTSRWWPLLSALSPCIRKLHRQDFRVDGPDTSSIFLSLSEQFVAAWIQ